MSDRQEGKLEAVPREYWISDPRGGGCVYYPPMLRVPALRLPKPPTFERNRIVCADVFDYLATIPALW